MKIRLALVAGSPVYYQAPLYRRLADDPRIDFTAIFASTAGALRPFDNGYGMPVEWGVDPLSGYRSVFLKRAARNPSGGSVLDLRDPDVVTQIWRGNYDALWLHGYHTVTHVLAAMAQKARGRPVLYREEQTLLNQRSPWKTFLKGLGLRRLFQGSYGLFIGTENQRWFQRWGLDPNRLFWTPYAVDNDALRAEAGLLASRRDEVRAEFGLPSDRPVVLMVGRLIEKKQPLRVLEAYASIRRKRRCALLVVGTGPFEADMRRVVREEVIPDVAFAGFLDRTRIGRAYAAADVFTLFSSHDETWGLVVNEALNFGLPVVVSDRVGSATDLVVDGGNGFTVPHDDVAALAGALERLVCSEALRADFGVAALEISSKYTYDRAAEGVIAAVAAAVGPQRWAASGPQIVAALRGSS